MRFRIFCFCLALTLGALPASAGTVTVGDGKIVWTSTQCTAPVPPTSLSNNAETPAGDMNARIIDYNNYTAAAEAYMKCLSDEAQKDADVTSKAVITAAQGAISNEQKKVAALAPAQHAKTYSPSLGK